MKLGFIVALVLTSCLATAPRLIGQAPAAGEAHKPTAGAPQSNSGANPFPEDMSTVPVLPSATTPAGNATGDENGFSSGSLTPGGEDLDPIRSPDDPARAAGSDEESSSSSLKNIENLLPPPDSDQPGKKKKLTVKEPTHQEAASKDIEVGGYYLDKKNWKAALSRFQSAMVLDPENPEVYWGLAEAERHLGELADARAHYLQLLDFDPDGPHGKQARKALKDPEVANGKNAVAVTSTAETTK
jgi:hypothetical protein